MWSSWSQSKSSIRKLNCMNITCGLMCQQVCFLYILELKLATYTSWNDIENVPQTHEFIVREYTVGFWALNVCKGPKAHYRHYGCWLKCCHFSKRPPSRILSFMNWTNAYCKVSLSWLFVTWLDFWSKKG